jgi:hypothetical protein
MTAGFPCTFSYCLEEEILARYKLPSDSALVFALERFRQDETRFSFGLVAVLETTGCGALFLGLNARRGAGCLGYATPTAIEGTPPPYAQRRWVVDGSVDAERASFHWFFPDCAMIFSRRLLLPPTRAIELAMGFARSGVWPADLNWTDDEES